jgi:hypothetical protein
VDQPRNADESPALHYLDRLCAALLARDPREIRRLLAERPAHSLPRIVREEALAIARAGPTGFRAPINALRLYHQTAQLLLAQPAEPPSDQIELPLKNDGE